MVSEGTRALLMPQGQLRPQGLWEQREGSWKNTSMKVIKP